MPGLFEEKSDIAKEKYLNNLMTKVYIDDIRKRINTKLIDELSSIVDLLCSTTGNLTNPLNISNYLLSEKKIKISHETIVSFLEAITNAYLFDHVKRYNIIEKKCIFALETKKRQSLCSQRKKIKSGFCHTV